MVRDVHCHWNLFFFLISSSWVNVDPSGQNFISFPSMSCRHTSPFNHGSVKLGTYIISWIMWSEFSLRETCFPIGKATQPCYHAERLSTRGQTAWRKELGHPFMDAPLEESGRTLDWIKLFRFNLSPSGKGKGSESGCCSYYMDNNKCSPGLNLGPHFL